MRIGFTEARGRGADRRRSFGYSAFREAVAMTKVEQKLFEALTIVNEELGIVGLRISLEAAARNPPDAARERDFILSCKGEAVPHYEQQAILTIGQEGVRILFQDPERSNMVPPSKMPPLESGNAYDFLLGVVELLLSPGRRGPVH
jgi:hypothetical protein